MRLAGLSERAPFGDISRILFSLTRVAVISLARFPERPAPLWYLWSPSALRLIQRDTKVVRGATNTRGFSSSRSRGKNQAGDPFLCFVLHRMGFLLQPHLRDGPVGSYPAFSTLLYTQGVQGGMFSVILSIVRSFRLGLPRFREACCLSVFGLSSGTSS